VMDRGLEAALSGRPARIETRCERPAAMTGPLF